MKRKLGVKVLDSLIPVACAVLVGGWLCSAWRGWGFIPAVGEQGDGDLLLHTRWLIIWCEVVLAVFGAILLIAHSVWTWRFRDPSKHPNRYRMEVVCRQSADVATVMEAAFGSDNDLLLLLAQWIARALLLVGLLGTVSGLSRAAVDVSQAVRSAQRVEAAAPGVPHAGARAPEAASPEQQRAVLEETADAVSSLRTAFDTTLWALVTSIPLFFAVTLAAGIRRGCWMESSWSLLTQISDVTSAAEPPTASDPNRAPAGEPSQETIRPAWPPLQMASERQARLVDQVLQRHERLLSVVEQQHHAVLAALDKANDSLIRRLSEVANAWDLHTQRLSDGFAEVSGRLLETTSGFSSTASEFRASCSVLESYREGLVAAADRLGMQVAEGAQSLHDMLHPCAERFENAAASASAAGAEMAAAAAVLCRDVADHEVTLLRLQELVSDASAALHSAAGELAKDLAAVAEEHSSDRQAWHEWVRASEERSARSIEEWSEALGRATDAVPSAVALAVAGPLADALNHMRQLVEDGAAKGEASSEQERLLFSAVRRSLDDLSGYVRCAFAEQEQLSARLETTAKYLVSIDVTLAKIRRNHLGLQEEASAAQPVMVAVADEGRRLIAAFHSLLAEHDERIARMNHSVRCNEQALEADGDCWKWL